MKAKKISQSISAVLLAISLLAGNMLFSVSAAELNSESVGEQSGDFEYELLSDGTASIKKYTGTEALVGIPSELDGHTVTKIGDSAFEECTVLKSVTIPDGVTSIGSYAFEKCAALETIAFPESLASIGWNALLDCVSLININVDENNAKYTSDDGILFNKEKTELIQYPAAKTLTEYSVPDSVTSIGRLAFSDCKALKTITIPDGVTRIGNNIFKNCSSLESINVGDGNEKYLSDNGVLFNKEKTELIQYPVAKALTEYSVPNGTIKIGNYSFSGSALLESVTIPESVTRIGDFSFSNCTSLKSITLPDSLTNLREYAFENCILLKNIAIPDGVTYIGNRVFENCTSLESIDVGSNNEKYTSEDGVLFDKNKTKLMQYPLGKELTEYSIPNSVTKVDTSAFKNCTSLESITIPDSVTSIEWYAFENCTSLKNITIPDSVTSIGKQAFCGCTSLESVTIPDSVTKIDDFAFGYVEGGKIEGFIIYSTAGSAAESYANDNNLVFMDAEAVIHKDANTGISVMAKPDVELKVITITDVQSINNANALLGDTETVKNLYDISLTKDGEKVQPEGMSEVKIPCDNENAKVYRVEDDNTLTEMKSNYQDGFIVFNTDHFSLYIVAEEKKAPETIGDMNKDGKIDVTDVTSIQIELANAGADYYDVVADTNKDGKVDVADVTRLQQFIAGVFAEL